MMMNDSSHDLFIFNLARHQSSTTNHLPSLSQPPSIWNARMDPFQNFPVPILESILELLPNLTTLYSLHNASPTVASILHENGVAARLIEIIISQSPPLIQSLIRVIALLRWNESSTAGSANLLPSSFAVFTKPYNQQKPVDRSISPDYGDACLPKSIPPTILCHILGLSTYVHQLTHACLHEMIARCMALNPMHLKDPKFMYRRRQTFERRQARPPGQPYQPVDCGPPSWAEEQRVARAIWRLVFYFMLRTAIVDRGLLGWKKDDVERLRNLRVKEFWDELLIGGEHEELKTVLDWIYPDCSATGKESPPWVDPASHLCSARAYCCPDSTPTTEEDWKVAQKNFAEFYSKGFAFGKQAIARLHSSPLKHVDFSVFRPYGFAIWDLKRMVALGFLEDYSRDDTTRNPHLSESNLLSTWESILTRAQLEEVEKKQKEQWFVS